MKNSSRKPKTNSEDPLEENIFMAGKKESPKLTISTINESESKSSTKVSTEYEKMSPGKESPSKRKKKLTKQDFIEYEILGCGSYGRVVKVQKKVRSHDSLIKWLKICLGCSGPRVKSSFPATRLMAFTVKLKSLILCV